MLKFTLTPFDVLFFGDARPFDKGSDSASIFPPFPHTVVSSIFARLYQEGIEYKDTPLINAAYGPFLEKAGTLYFPCPMDIFIDEDSGKIEIVKPLSSFNLGNSLIDFKNTDLGDKAKDFLWYRGESDKKIKSFNGFITLQGLKKWCNGNIPAKEDLKESSYFYTIEERIGINIDDETGTTKSEDGLYRVSFVRLKKDVSLVMWLDFNLENLKSKFNDEKSICDFYNNELRVLKLGGESKNAYYSCEMNDFKNIVNCQTTNSFGKKKILFLTPGIFAPDKLSYDNDKNIIDKIGGFYTGIIGKYIIAGVNQKRAKSPKTIRAIKPGSVIYCECQEKVIGFFNKNDDCIGSNLVLIL